MNIPRFIHLSVGQDFYFLATMNNGIMNIMCTVFCVNMVSFLLGMYLAVELLEGMVTLCLTF